MNSSTFTDQTEQTEEFEWGATSVDSMLGRALWSRESPKTIMVVDGEITTAAATCPPANVIADLFMTLLRVRQAEFEAQAGVKDPDAWNTGAEEPGVPIDLERELDGEEFGSAYARWRHQWLERIALYPWQEQLRETSSHSALARLGRSWFEAWLHKYFGNRHIARAVIRYGTMTAASLTSLHVAIVEEKKEEGNKRKFQEDAHGAGEPVCKLKWDAHHARKALRDGERLAKKVDTGITQMGWLDRHQRQLLEDLYARRLHVRVGRANTAYGHDIAWTHDFGFKPRENMCRDVPIEVRAHVRTLQTS